MSVFSGEQGKKQAFLVVLPGKLDLENSPLMLGSPLPSVGGFHIIAGKFDSISKSCIQVSWLTGYRSLNGRGVGSRAETWAQLCGDRTGSVCAEGSGWNRSEESHRIRNGVGGSQAASVRSFQSDERCRDRERRWRRGETRGDEGRRWRRGDAGDGETLETGEKLQIDSCHSGAPACPMCPSALVFIRTEQGEQESWGALHPRAGLSFL